MPLQDALLADDGARLAGERVEGGGAVDVLPVEVEAIGLVLFHHSADLREEEAHVLTRARARRPSSEVLEAVQGRRFESRPPQEVVGAGVDDEPHSQPVERLSDAGELLGAQPWLEAEVPVLPQQDLGLEEHHVAVFGPGLQDIIGRVRRLVRPVPDHLFGQGALPVVGLWRADADPQDLIGAQRILGHHVIVGICRRFRFRLGAVHPEGAPLVSEDVVVLVRRGPQNGDPPHHRCREGLMAVEHQQGVAIDPDGEGR